TGTAERETGKQDTSWFASMVGPDPANPQSVIVTMVAKGGFGGQTAAPITRQIIDGIYPNIGDASHPSCTTPDRGDVSRRGTHLRAGTPSGSARRLVPDRARVRAVRRRVAPALLGDESDAA